MGSLIYTRDENNLDLESASFGSGRINKTSGGYETSYFITDHLGSVRATVNQNGALNSTNNYYPFGLRWDDPNALISTNRWLYSGKEMQITAFPETSGIFDFGWRMNDSRIGRWKNSDKLSEKYFPISPYAYCANNPLRFMDPDGKKIVDATGKPITYSKDKGWSSNATADVQRVGEAMMRTEVGTKHFNDMISLDNPTAITINIDNKSGIEKVNGGIRTGLCETSIIFDSKTGEVLSVESATITLFTSAIEYLTDKDSESNLAGLPLEDALGAVAGHEKGHTEKKNREEKRKGGNAETYPDQIQQEIIDELNGK